MGSSTVLDKIQHPIVLFDTECLLCNNTVKLLIKADRKNTLYFGGLSSKVGIELINKYNINEDSVVLYNKNRLSIKSTAFIEISRELGFPYSIAMIFYAIPRQLRDAVYDFVAKKRFKWFGRVEQCIIPERQFKNRLLD